MAKILGTTTIYHGTEHRYLAGHEVKIVAVLKNAALPDLDETGYRRIDDEDELERAGGVTATDRIEVTPWIAEQGRYSFATSDALATDLGCFGQLAN